MTAEIAIVNRSAITLAADSAMTLSVGGRRKIYLTDKIFELSERDPIGLMIYNNLEFMGAPIDVLIKHFRTSPSCCAFKAISECPEAFFDYLSDKWMPSVELQERHVKQILSKVYRKVFRTFERERRSFVLNKKKSADTPLGLLLKCVKKEIADIEKYPVATCFHDVPESDLLTAYEKVVDRCISSEFHKPPLGDDETDLCRHLGALSLHREVFSEIMSGLVFAGFGSNEVFPSLSAFHIDGIILGKLKKKATEEVSTSREEISAKVIPFAQRDVVDRFLVGLDPDLEKGIKKYMEKIRDYTENQVFDGVPKLGAKARQRIMSNLEAVFGEPLDLFDESLQEIKESYSKETEDMVLFMAKQESAHLAEALVNITSLKRKYSPDEESVSGPIDVAVISRSDGFVWVKRKHYFPSELNQRYFIRKFERNSPVEGGGHAAGTT